MVVRLGKVGAEGSMRWDETDKILSLDREEPLATGLAELFHRVLSVGRQRMAGRDQDWQWLSVRAAPFVDYPGLLATNDRGSVWVEFGPETEWSLRNDPVRFGLESSAYRGAVHNADWTEEEMDLVTLRLNLELYEQIRKILATPPHRDWWTDWQTTRSFPLLGYVISGTVNLRIGEAAMEPLPEYECRLLAGDSSEEADTKDVKMLPGLVPYNLVRGSTSMPQNTGGAEPGASADSGRDAGS
jgi:hypothetical protein